MAVLYPREPIELDSASLLVLDVAGAEANLAIGLSRLGHRVRFVSRVGDDRFGRRICAALATATQREDDTAYLGASVPL
jgi:2-dehydro-3-deoxygluconokinase